MYFSSSVHLYVKEAGFDDLCMESIAKFSCFSSGRLLELFKVTGLVDRGRCSKQLISWPG